ncbi:NAD(P)/FAD-dependent oxidoreductase [uncultured Ferrovibrio sp.]|jgi:thioredoxin reductase (NADPH)|uniref:NAD(P)/FAD-dependent oxidoreductase n=1 Tax=uncultured Ferrovibrio sp. TaxID=1576913 RepID=UPI002604959B|nr:NAD(P)/FAD-dependent oxidoreductase [uncultured Ferrovibrio sp.]
MSHQTDIAVIGAGPVGLFAVFECGMVGLRCHVIDALDAIGGQCSALYPEKPIYDIPGFPRISGAELIAQLEQQIAPMHPVFHLGQRVEKLEGEAGNFRLTTSKGTVIEARAVIIAAGAGAFGPNRPPLAGIEAYEGRRDGTGVHYLVRRAEDFRGKRIVIAGGGDSAVDWALALHGVAAHIDFVHRRDQFRAAPENVSRLRALNGQGLDIVVPYQLDALDGDGATLSAVIVRSLDGDVKRLEADALLAFFGLKSDLGPIANWGMELALHHLPVDPSTCQTSKSGIFAIGDVATYPGKLKLILTGFAEAASAAHAIYPMLQGKPLHFEYSTSKGAPGIGS